MDSSQYLLAGLAVFNPKEGGGFPQTLLASMIIVGCFVLLFQGKTIPNFLSLLLGAMSGYFFNNEIQRNMNKKRK